jgi:hypothetical protein
MLGGAIASGMMLALMMANAGGAWDNAKKYIEIEGGGGGKGTEAHKACVVGDTVGDPFKDTSGPALNILIKLMSIISLTIAPLISGNPSWPSTFWIGIIMIVIMIMGTFLVYYSFWREVADITADVGESADVETGKEEEKPAGETHAAAADENVEVEAEAK